MIYEKYKKNKKWKIVEKCIADLVKNKDIFLKTDSDYVVGYVVKKITENDNKNYDK